MKRPVICLSIFILIFTSCKFGMPTGVKIKTNADYNFCVAKVDKDFNEALDLSTMFPNDPTGKMQIYSYNPGGKSSINQMMVKMQIQEIPLDFSEYMDKINLTEDLKNMSVDNIPPVTIPKVEFSADQEMDLSSVNQAVNALVTIGGTSGTNIPISYSLGSDNFDSVKYTSGKIKLTCLGQTGTVKLKLLDGKEVSGTFNNGEAILSLNDITLTKTGMTLDFSGAPELPFVGVVSEDSKIESVTGLTIVSQSLDIPVNQQFPMPAVPSLKECEIGAGSLKIEIASAVGWVNFSSGISGKITGALDIDPFNGNADLANKTFVPGNINISGNLSLSLTNTTIVFANKPKIKISCNVTSFNSATIKLDDSTKATIGMSQPLPQESLGMIDKIVWAPSGIKINYSSTLPAGNDIKIQNVKSTFLNINEAGPDTLVEGTPLEILCADDTESSILKGGPGGLTDVDFDAEMLLPGFVEDPSTHEKTITIQNVVAGETYTINLSVEPVFEWKKIFIDPSAIAAGPGGGSGFTGDLNSGVDLSSLFSTIDQALFTPADISAGKGFAGNVKVKNVPFYLFCNIPSVITDNGAKFSGKIKAFIGDKSTSADMGITPVYILGDGSNNGELQNSTEPELEIKNNEVVTDFSKLSVMPADFKDLINTQVTDGVLCVNYDVTFASSSGSMEITNEKYARPGDITLTDTNNTISLSAVIVFPFKFEALNPIPIDVLSLAGNAKDAGWDLMGRSEATAMDSDFFKAIKNVGITYAPTKLPFGSANSMDLKIVIPDTVDNAIIPGQNYKEENLSLSGGTIDLNPSELLSLYPLEPSIEMVLPAGDFWVNKNLGFATDVKLKIQTDGEIAFDFSGANE